MPRRQRNIKARAKRLAAEIEKSDYIAKTPGRHPLKDQFKGHVRDLARAYTEVAIKELVSLMSHSKSEATRLLAASTVLERGWGKPAQALAGPDGEGEAVMRHVHEVKRTLVRSVARPDNENSELRQELPRLRRTDS